ncbi:MAG: hypothetical protein PVI78_10300 [Anaerolineales bacterium]
MDDNVDVPLGYGLWLAVKTHATERITANNSVELGLFKRLLAWGACILATLKGLPRF